MNLLKKISFIILLLLFSCNKEQLSEEINTYHNEISKHELNDISTLKYYQRLIENNKSIPDSIKAQNNYLIGSYLYKNSIKDSASVYLRKATTLIDKQNFTEKSTTYFFTLWECYKAQEKYGDCSSTSERFKALIDLENDSENAALYYYFEEYYYRMTYDFKKALKSNKKRIIALDGKEEEAKSRALISKATIKDGLGDRQGGMKILENLVHKSDQFSNDFNRETFGEYANMLFYEDKYDECLKFNIKGLEYAKQIDANTELKQSYIANYYINISEVYMLLKEYETSQKYLDSIQTTGYQNLEFRLQKATFKYQARLNNATKQYGKTIKDIDKFFSFLDEGYDEKIKKELADLVASNEKGERLLNERIALELKTEKIKSQTYIISFGFIILILIGIILYNRNRFKHKKEKLFINQQLFRSQMNPHFTFNALSVIQNYIKKDPATASTYLMKFSRLLRLTLENSLSNYVSLEKELESLKKYMELQTLRFPNKFEHDITLAKMPNLETVYIPPMLIQPFIENSINHGFSGIQYKGKIIVVLAKYNEKYLQCIINDNGKGIQEKGSKHRTSASTKLIANFIKRTTNTEIKITDLSTLNSDETGINVQFLIPYKLENYD